MKPSLQLTSALLLGSLAFSANSAIAADKEPFQPLTLTHMTALPDITGDFDHFAVDLKRNHLFVSAEVHHSIEMFDLQTGEHLQSIPGFKTPHSLAFVPEKDELLVADGGDSSLILISGDDFHRINRIQLIDGSATGKGDSPDAGYYDAANRLYYVGNGGISANMPDSRISIFSVDQGKLIGDISIPGNNVSRDQSQHLAGGRCQGSAHLRRRPCTRHFVCLRQERQGGSAEVVRGCERRHDL